MKKVKAVYFNDDEMAAILDSQMLTIRLLKARIRTGDKKSKIELRLAAQLYERLFQVFVRNTYWGDA